MKEKKDKKKYWNWIRIINRLYSFTQTHPISNKCLALYHFLLYLFSRSWWATEISPPLSVLAAGAGMSEKSVQRARKELFQLSFIKVSYNGANRSATYTLRMPPVWGLLPEKADEMENEFAKLREKEAEEEAEKILLYGSAIESIEKMEP